MKRHIIVNAVLTVMIIILTAAVMYQYMQIQRVKKEMGLQILLSYHSMRNTVTDLKNYLDKNGSLDANTLLLYNTKLDGDREYLNHLIGSTSKIHFTYVELEDNMNAVLNNLKVHKDISAAKTNLLKILNETISYHLSIANQLGKGASDELKCYSLYQSGKL